MRLKKRPMKVFRRDGGPVLWRATCASFGPGHDAQVEAETARQARRRGARALGVHPSVVHVTLVG